MTKPFHHTYVDVGCFNEVTQVGFCLKYLSEIAKEGDKNVAVFRVVEDGVLHDLRVFSQVFIFRGDHFIDVEKKLFVGLEGIVESGGREGEGEGGRGGGQERGRKGEGEEGVERRGGRGERGEGNR